MPHEARMIKSIPLCFTDAEDKLYWPSMVDGVYVVKVEYRLLIKNKLISNAGPLTPPPPNPKSTWKGLWKLRIPNKTKTLVWRAILDALPTQVNLVKRKVLSDATYQLCGLEQESTLHALWSCPKLNKVWDVHFNSLRDKVKECDFPGSISSVHGESPPLGHACYDNIPNLAQKEQAKVRWNSGWPKIAKLIGERWSTRISTGSFLDTISSCYPKPNQMGAPPPRIGSKSILMALFFRKMVKQV